MKPAFVPGEKSERDLRMGEWSECGRKMGDEIGESGVVGWGTFSLSRKVVGR